MHFEEEDIQPVHQVSSSGLNTSIVRIRNLYIGVYNAYDVESD